MMKERGFVVENLDRGGKASLVGGVVLIGLGFSIGAPIALAGIAALWGKGQIENSRKNTGRYV